MAHASIELGIHGDVFTHGHVLRALEAEEVVVDVQSNVGDRIEAHLLLQLLQQELNPSGASKYLVPDGLPPEALAKPQGCHASFLEAPHQFRCGEESIARLQLVPEHEGLLGVVFNC